MRPSVGIPFTVLEVTPLTAPELWISALRKALPTNRKLDVAVPLLQVKVTEEDVNVDPGTGVSITDGPVGGGVGVRVGVGVALGVGVGVGVPLGPPVQLGNLKEPMRVIQFRPGDE